MLKCIKAKVYENGIIHITGAHDYETIEITTGKIITALKIDARPDINIRSINCYYNSNQNINDRHIASLRNKSNSDIPIRCNMTNSMRTIINTSNGTLILFFNGTMILSSNSFKKMVCMYQHVYGILKLPLVLEILYRNKKSLFSCLLPEVINNIIYLM